MKRCIRFLTLLVLVILLATAASAVFARGETFTLARTVYGGGSPPVSAGSYTAQGTFGQAVMSGPTPVGKMSLCSGFWCDPLATMLFLPATLK